MLTLPKSPFLLSNELHMHDFMDILFLIISSTPAYPAAAGLMHDSLILLLCRANSQLLLV